MPPQAALAEQDEDAAGLVAETGLASERLPSRQPQSRQAEPQFEVVETDSDYNPLTPEHPQQGDGEAEANLNTDDNAERTFLEEQEEERHREREPRAARRARQKAAKDRSEQTINILTRRVAELEGRVEQGIEPRLSGYDQAQVRQQVSDIDRKIDTVAQQGAAAYQRMSQAMTDQDGEAFGKALAERDKAIMAGQQLTVQKNLLETGDPLGRRRETQPDTRAPARQPAQQPQAAPLPRAAVHLANEFLTRHAWMQDASDPRKMDVRIARDIDNEVMRDGYDPTTQDYWDEVEDRMREYLPHRFETKGKNGARPADAARPQPSANGGPVRAQQPPQRRGPMVGGPADRGPTNLSPNKVYISPERKAAMAEVGAIDSNGAVVDRKKYDRLIKSFHEYDRANPGVARR